MVALSPLEAIDSLPMDTDAALADLEAEEELAKSLQHRLSLLEAQQAKTDDELQAARAAKMDAEARVATAKTAKLRALERERALWPVELVEQRRTDLGDLAAIGQRRVSRLARGDLGEPLSG